LPQTDGPTITRHRAPYISNGLKFGTLTYSDLPHRISS